MELMYALWFSSFFGYEAGARAQQEHPSPPGDRGPKRPAHGGAPVGHGCQARPPGGLGLFFVGGLSDAATL